MRSEKSDFTAIVLTTSLRLGSSRSSSARCGLRITLLSSTLHLTSGLRLSIPCAMCTCACRLSRVVIRPCWMQRGRISLFSSSLAILVGRKNKLVSQFFSSCKGTWPPWWWCPAQCPTPGSSPLWHHLGMEWSGPPPPREEKEKGEKKSKDMW